MKLLLALVVIFSVIQAMDDPTLLFPVENWEISGLDTHPVGLNDFIQLKDEVGQLCKKPHKRISTEFSDGKILRIRSEGEVTKIDCEAINWQLRIECSNAAGILKSIGASNSAISSTVALAGYNKARLRYRNAFNILTYHFKLHCYSSFEKLHQVLIAFIESESDALRVFSQRKLDNEIQKLFYSLCDIVKEEKNRESQIPKPFIAKDNTKDLVYALGHNPFQKSVQDGITHRDAARELFKRLQDPTIESVDSIEIFTFIAFEHFITAFNKGHDNALEEAKLVLTDLEAIHILKEKKYGAIGQRYPLAKQKFDFASQNSLQKIRERVHYQDLTGKFLREEATCGYSSSDASVEKKPVTKDGSSSQEEHANESERAIRELTHSNTAHSPAATIQSQKEKTTPLSLLKAAVNNTQAGGIWVWQKGKKVWQKLPFN